MSRARRIRFLAVAVMAMAAILLVVSRQVGKSELGGRKAGGRAPAEEPVTADALAPGGPALSFYETLGVTPEGGAAAHAPARPRLEPAEGDRPPGGGFVIQVLATAHKHLAQEIRDKVTALGPRTRLIEGILHGEPIYRVRAGPYRDRSTAVAWSKKIEAKLEIETWVLQEAE